MTTLLRYAVMTAPPLVLAGVLLMHPNDEADTIYGSVRPIVDGPLTLTRSTAFSRCESGVVVLALAAVALHLIDDNYLPRERP